MRYVLLLLLAVEAIANTLQDYRWHWHSFFTAASSALWIFAYCTYYYVARLNLDGFVSSVLFFGYSAIGCTLYALTMGTLGYVTAAFFVGKIYSAIKVD
jgi:transmembrane 9 superfamily protein 2/4